MRDLEFTLVTANDISSALQQLESRPIDLIITGLELKGGGGEFFIRQLNGGKFRNIPVIVMTSTDTMQVRTEMFKLGVIDFIHKDQAFKSSLLRFLGKMTERDRVRDELINMNIAVIDDSKIQHRVLKNIFQLNRIPHVDFYSDSDFVFTSQKRYQMYLVDLVLPKRSGEQVILTLRKKYPDAIIIAISGIDNYKVVSNVLYSGADDYILKPFNASILMARIISNVRTYLLLKELSSKKRELKQSVVSDSLTGFYNQQHIIRLFKEELEKTYRNNDDFSLLLLDVDNIEMIHDNYGLEMGNKVIRKISQIIKGQLDETCYAGRYGVSEFLVLCPGAASEQICEFAEQIRSRVSAIKAGKLRLSVSGGVCESAGESGEELLRKADSLLFNAKKMGKNRIEHDFHWDSYETGRLSL